MALSFSNTMESSILVNTVTDTTLPFIVKLYRYNQALPFTLTKSPVAIAHTRDEVLDPPLVSVKFYPAADSYVREDVDNLNFGQDKYLFMRPSTSGLSALTYLYFDLSQRYSTYSQSLLVDVRFHMHTSATVTTPRNIIFSDAKGTWFENDINWFNQPGPASTAHLTAAISKSSDYTITDWTATNVKSLDTLNIVGAADATLTTSSRESANPPYIEFRFLDLEAMKSLGASYRPFKLVPSVPGSAYLPFTLDLQSKNRSWALPFYLAVQSVNPFKFTTRAIGDLPFGLQPTWKRSNDLRFILAVNDIPSAKFYVKAINDIPFSLVSRPNVTIDVPFYLAVNANNGLKFTANPLGDLPLDLTIRAKGDYAIPFYLAVNGNSGLQFTTTAIGDLPFTLSPKIIEDKALPFYIAVNAYNGFKFTATPINDLPFSINPKVTEFREFPFYIAVNSTSKFKFTTKAISDLPFELRAVVSTEANLPFTLKARQSAVSDLPFNLYAQPVSTLPFSFGVISPYLKFNINPRVPDAAYLPFTTMPRLRRASDLPIIITVRETPNSYVQII